MNRRKLCAFLGAYILLGCSSKQASEKVRQLQWLDTANPIADATSALAKNDKRLVGIYGFTWTIPGVEEQRKEDYRDRYGLRMLDGTSDAPVNAEHERLVDLAGRYAKKYNSVILTHEK
jgi:hypothetical protein